MARLTDPPCGHKSPGCCRQTWPTAIVELGGSGPAVIALQVGNSRHHIDEAAARELLSDLIATLDRKPGA